MTCSRCHARNIPGDAVVCPNCGGTLVSDEAPRPPMPEELERALKRDLGGQFQINELLGRGGMSLVYLAYEIQLNRPVALKVLPLQLAYGADAAERFEREAKIAAALDHPHIVPIYRVGATGTFLWYSMKRIKGRSLAEILEQSERPGVDGRSDQYSLAIVTYECLSGAPPFTGDSYGELVRKHLLEPAPRITDKRPDVPAPVADALQKALSKKPDERFRDVAEFVHALGGRA